MAVPEQSPHSSALHSVICFAELDFNVPIKVVALFYFFRSSLRENAEPVIAPFVSAAAKRELDSTMLLTLHSRAKKTIVQPRWPHRLPHDATARQRNGWPSLNRTGRVSLAMFPTSSAEETCMCVQCGCAGACCLHGALSSPRSKDKRLRLPNRLAPPPRFLDNPAVEPPTPTNHHHHHHPLSLLTA